MRFNFSISYLIEREVSKQRKLIYPQSERASLVTR